MTRAYIPALLRKQVVERAHGHCEYCLLHEDDGPLSHQIDHVIPVKHGGDTTDSNLCLACLDCNR